MQEFKAKDYMNGNDYIYVFKSGSARSKETHTHDFVEIVYVTSGKMEQVINGKSYTVCRGDLLFMNVGCTHSFAYTEHGGFVNILFSPALIGKELIAAENALPLLALSSFDEIRNDADFGKISFFGEEREAVENVVGAMLQEHDRKKSSYGTVLGNYLSILFVHMIRKLQNGLDEGEIDEMWQNLSAFIDANLGNKLSLSDLAQKCFYNPSYFSRVFKEKFGVSFVEYITKKRVDAAIKLLKTTEISVDDISRKVGFSDRSSFYHAFSRFEKGTPLDHRRDMAGKEGTE